MNTSFIKFIVIAVLVVGSIFAFVGCERIDAGHVGVKVNLYGDLKFNSYIYTTIKKHERKTKIYFFNNTLVCNILRG